VERLNQRLAIARAALDTLDELVRKSVRSKVERDAAIQRFEYTFEATWKAAQSYLREVEGLEVGSPKRAARAALQVGLFDAAHTHELLAMVDDRNLTVHTYNEQLAEEIDSRLSGHALLLQHWLDQMAARFLESTK
jgi:nucleotidyltransferase substrate binding protein (TIGR01987 family)